MNRPPLLLLAHCTVFRYYIAIFRYYIALCDCIDVCCERHCVSYKTSRVLLLAAVAVVGVVAATATAAVAAVLAVAVAVAVAVACAVCFPGPHTAAARPADTTRRAARRDARRFCKGHGCPLQKFLPALRTWSAQRGRREDGVCFFGYFLCTSKESNSRPKGVKALLPVSSCIKENTQPRGARTKTQKLHSPHPTKQPVNRSTGQPVNQPHTFNNKNSRSHELITRKNVSYSFRFTEI